ncbi:MAG: peptidyl-prolyl cis-trans isomerase [Aquificae bacterium]|nr:peptidyl-prolyl cis-trans isomerase [Aquificota bacterium]
MKFLIGMFAVLFMFFNTFAEEKNPVVLLKTNLGEIYIELYPKKAPKTVKQFLRYVKEGFYDGLIFHRVIPNFVIQAGGFDKNFKYREPKYPPIPNEADNGLKNLRGTVAMARSSDPHSANAQFFINLKDNHFLDFKSKTPQGWGYTVFGKVIKGMEVVDKIAKIPTKTAITPYGYMRDVPTKPVVIEKAVILK